MSKQAYPFQIIIKNKMWNATKEKLIKVVYTTMYTHKVI